MRSVASVLTDALEPGDDDADGCHQRDADRQRRGGRRGAARDGASRCGARANRRCRRTARPRDRRPTRSHARSGRRCPGRGTSIASRIALTGEIRVARRAGRRAASSGTPMPTITAAITTPEVSVIAVVGRPRPSASNSAPMPAAMAKPPARPSSRADDADRQRLHPHEPLDLPARGAGRPQQRELPRALGDGQAERVGDRHRADDDGDAAEDEQPRGAQEGHETPSRPSRSKRSCAAAVRTATSPPSAVREPGAQRLPRRAPGDEHRRRRRPGLPNSSCAVAQVEHGGGGRPERRDGAEAPRSPSP